MDLGGRGRALNGGTMGTIGTPIGAVGVSFSSDLTVLLYLVTIVRCFAGDYPKRNN